MPPINADQQDGSSMENKNQVDTLNEHIEGIGEDTSHRELTEIRKGIERANEEKLGPHNVPLLIMGVLILWVGWLLFNAGSSLGISNPANREDAMRAMMNTFISPAVAGLVAMTFKSKITKQEKDVKFNLTSLANGILAGLVGITASCNTVYPWCAVIIGIISALFYSLACLILLKCKIDDPLEAF